MVKNQKFTDALLIALDEKLDDLADFIFTKSQENIVANEIVDQGILLSSGNVEREFLKKKIVYSAAHAAPMEFGSQPHHPPVQPLEQWAKRKLGLKGKDAKSTAWAIAKHINENGTDPKPYLTPAVNFAEERFR